MRKFFLMLLLVGVANFAEAGRWSALEKTAALVKRLGWRASVAVSDKQKRLGTALATLGVAALMLTSTADVSEARTRTALGGEIVFYAPGFGVGNLSRITGAYDSPTNLIPPSREHNIVSPTSLYAMGIGLRPFPRSTAEIKVFNFQSLHEKRAGGNYYQSGIDDWFSDGNSDMNLVVALTHQLFAVRNHSNYMEIVGPFDYGEFSVHIGFSYNRYATYSSFGDQIIAHGKGLNRAGVAWQLNVDVAHYFDNRISLGWSYFGSYAGSGAQVHYICLNTCIGFLE